KCVWCKTDKTNIGDFKIPNWKMRDLDEMMKIGERAARANDKKTFSKRHSGIVNRPIFCIPISHIVPCGLHLLMAIIRRLLALLVQEAENNLDLAKQVCVLIEEHVKLVPEKTE